MAYCSPAGRRSQPQLVRVHPRQGRLGVAAADEMDDDGQVDSYAPGFLALHVRVRPGSNHPGCIGTNAAVKYICWILIGFLFLCLCARDAYA